MSTKFDHFIKLKYIFFLLQNSEYTETENEEGGDKEYYKREPKHNQGWIRFEACVVTIFLKHIRLL